MKDLLEATAKREIETRTEIGREIVIGIEKGTATATVSESGSANEKGKERGVIGLTMITVNEKDGSRITTAVAAEILSDRETYYDMAMIWLIDQGHTANLQCSAFNCLSFYKTFS